MSRPSTIADILGSPAMFYRSVALERDAADPTAGRSFVLTPWLERGAGEILSGMRAGSTRRAWRIIGDFGVGKSALALALVQALDPRVCDDAMPMRALAYRLGGTPRMFPLLVTGSRNGLAAALSAAIEAVVASGAGIDGSWSGTIRAIDDPFAAITALRDALRATGCFDGLLVVIDEMGKFLEAASEEEGFDVFRLQALAEAAARSGEAPLGVVLILHKGFQSYAEDWRTARRSEWEKVAERFEEMVFDHPLSHTAALLAAALDVDADAIPPKVRKSHVKAVRDIRALGWLGPRNATGNAGAWPLHPAAIPVMARFFATFGQNERSLFGFAASEEPNGLRAFAAATRPDGGLYGIPRFFDYVASSFGHRLTSRAGAGEWDRIGAVLDRAVDADAIETDVLKTVGILNLLDAPDLPATTDSVRAALAPSLAGTDVDQAIERLIAGGLVFRRPGRAELRLWTSRRVDLSAIWVEAEREIEARGILRELPRHLTALPIRPHVLARRHSVTRGTTRRFAIRCTHAAGLAGNGRHPDADGVVVAVLCADSEDRLMALAWSQEVTGNDETAIAIVVPPMPELGSTMVDLLRHRWIAANAAELREDAFAMAEIERTIADLETHLVAAVETGIGLRGQAPTMSVEVYLGGQAVELARPVHTLVSSLCDEAYRDAPRIENELVNRHALTSAGAGARQRLIELMFDKAHDPELGFKPGKNPPERALFLSLLRRGRVHRENGGGWSILPPLNGDDPLNLLPALGTIRSRLEKDGDRVALPDLYALVEGRPWGVRRGLSPLLLAITLVAAGHRVALFERGTYCTKLDGAAFMRILKAPENFALQWVSLEGVRADVFHRLTVLLDRVPEESGLRLVVDPLIRFGVDLPFHVQHSSALGPQAKAVRRALSQARSPIDLIFADLPAACGVEPFAPSAQPDAERAADFVSRLNDAVEQLRGCYPTLLEGMRSETLSALGAPDRAALAERAAALGFRIKGQALKTFALRLADTGQGEDQWTEALGGAVLGKPPVRWLDHDVDIWRSQLAELAAHFLRVEAAAFGETETMRNAVRVSLTRVDGEERAVIVDVGQLDEAQSEAMGAIERLAEGANLSLDTVAALLALEGMRGEAAKTAERPSRKERA
ncbi:hypothetical protein ASE90_09120 [Sphingomonas sp. Leaf67]|uniref:hypothetical protein n=1 Tax=Sphingomonas sp. Leaf67 TaxID=1736230 RepID=UPI000713D61B|nr:hypothetical protein [Sphingomonas sp. Leaf67]KQN82918.1 hypothetical protein ASE90_09120 [Sphingomonas sp. Leaf67]